jgi:cyclohexadieny/prephenate dehydrogenase
VTSPVFSSVAIVGIGLIGSSIARSCAASGAAGNVHLFDLDPAVRAQARDLGLGEVFDTAIEAAKGAELVIVCTPVGAIAAAVAAVSDGLSPGTILTDVGSVKGAAQESLLAAAPPGVHVIPGHPIAGTERSGPDAGFASLFQGRWHILTPIGGDQSAGYPEAIDRLSAFWSALGARVEIMDAAQHDRILAITSHLPHLIAYNIVATAADLESVTESDVVKYSAGGFRDFTRIAASDPVMWRDVFLTNREAVLEMLGRFTEDLAALQRAIRWGDGDALHALFTRARHVRRDIIEAGQDSADPNFGRDKG